MKVILDTSVVLGEGQSSFRYFSELIPFLRKEPHLQVELIPSPYMKLPESWYSESQSYKPILPSAPWFPQGKIRKVLSRVKGMVEGSRKKRAFKPREEQTLFHTFYYTLPPSPQIPLVTMALDAIMEIFGTELDLTKQFGEHLKAKQESLQAAKRIIAISEATKRDIAKVYGISLEKIDCIHLSVSRDFYPASPSRGPSQKPYLLQVGGRMNHRNFSRLLEAFALGRFSKDFLLVCGGEPWSEAEQRLIKKLNLEKSVSLVKHPTNDQLRELYQNAEMLVYPSLYEGFGFPLVEAMACGTPVVTSKESGSIPEIAADAALYFDPRDPSDMAKAMTELLKPELANKMREKGFENIKRFSWEKTAAQTISCYRKVFSE